MKLLYVEDEESMAEAVTDILVFHKYQVDTVYDGEEALEYARKRNNQDTYYALGRTTTKCKSNRMNLRCSRREILKNCLTVFTGRIQHEP